MDFKINNLFFTNFAFLLIINIIIANTNSVLSALILFILLLLNLGIFILSNYNIFVKKDNNKIYSLYKKLTLIDLFFFFLVTLLFSPFLFIFILVIFLSILGHEAGHAFFMKLFGVKLVDFSIGFGTPLYTKKKGNISFNIRNILLGGYVKPIDDIISKDLKNLKKDKTNIKEIEKKHNIKENELYLSKKLWQKILILTGGVLFNLIFAISSIFAFIKISGNGQQKENLTKQQKEFITKEKERNKGDKKIFKYISEKMQPTIWLHTRKPSDNILYDTVYETKQAILLTYYSMVYAVNNPSAFLHFKSFVGIGKDIYKLEKHNLMNWKILFAVVALINISLFLINILPLPALDGGQIVKEMIAHTLHKIKKKTDNLYYKIIFSKYVIFAEYVTFTIILIYMIVLVIKDIFT